MSGGGGGGSGDQSWPGYMEDQHADWLEELDDTEIPGMIALNPFTAAVAYDPDFNIDLAWDAVCEFDAFVDGLNAEDDWESAIVKVTNVIDSVIITDAYIDADVSAYGDTLDDELNTKVLPEFKNGMRDIGAINTSAFVLGEADIYAKRNRDVARYSAELRMKLNFQRNEMIYKSADRVITSLMMTAEFEGAVANISVDAQRIFIVAKTEENNMGIEFAESDGRWNNEAYQYGANMLAAMSGGVRGGASKPSAAMSALSGGLSGAALGAKVTGGNPIGAAAGGLLGVGLSFIM